MGVKQIQALESGDYAALPTGTFLRGFVRNYANAVGLDPKAVLAHLEETHMPARAVHATPVVEPARQKMAVRPPSGVLASPPVQGAIVAAVILLLGAAFAYWWTFMRASAVGTTTTVSAPLVGGQTQAQSETKVEPVRSPDNEVPVAQPPIAGAAMPPQAGETAVSTPPAPMPAEPESAPKDKAAKPEALDKKPRAAGTSVVGLTFTGESWVEITDANGRVILSKKFRAGDAEEVTGRGPLSVIVGNASNTRMALNGLEFDLTPHTRGAVARVNAK